MAEFLICNIDYQNMLCHSRNKFTILKKHVARNTTNNSNKLRVVYDYIILHHIYWSHKTQWGLPQLKIQ